MVATSQTLASAAALRVLHEGGNAVDAALTAVAVLSVVEPSMTGVGGDLFALVHDPATGIVHGLDSSGRSGHRAAPAVFAARALTALPASGPLLVTVPGAVEGWHQLQTRFGSRTLAQIVEPAVGYARDGFPVAAIMAAEWEVQTAKLAADAAAARTFLPGGRAPREGEVFRNPALARSLETIGRDGPDGFYRGPLAEAIAVDLAARDGLLDASDLASHTADWLAPIRTTYRGVEVLEMPPSTQGFVALQMLNVLEGFDVASLGHNSADYLHLVAEAKKLAFADRGTLLSDRDVMPAGVLDRLLSKEYAGQRRLAIRMDRAGSYAAGENIGRSAARDFAGSDRGDTVYLTVADESGLVVSLIQSLFGSFGAGIVAGDTGIVLHNRGSGFTLAEGHPNQIGPRKRPLHTLVPAMVLRDGRPWVSFGVMGGDNQAQAHAQVVANLVDFGMGIQAAGEAARVRHAEPNLAVESGVTPEVRAELEARGHTLVDGRGQMGGFQGILIDHDAGVFMGGSDPRKDGAAIGW